MATGRFVFGRARGWRSARRFRLWLGIPNAVLRRDDQKSRSRARHPLSCVHVTSVRLLALICLTFFSSWNARRTQGLAQVAATRHRCSRIACLRCRPARLPPLRSREMVLQTITLRKQRGPPRGPADS